MFTLNEIYDLAIQIEKNGEDYYREAEKKVSETSLKDQFLRLADQEAKHKNQDTNDTCSSTQSDKFSVIK